MTTSANVDPSFSWQFDTNGRTATSDRDHHVREMVEQVLFTAPGERVNRPDFGSGLLELVFAGNSPELAAAVEISVQAALQRWLGDLIEIRELRVLATDATLTVDLVYLVRRTGELRADTFSREAAP